MSTVNRFEQQINEMKIPEIDIHDQIMDAVAKKKQKRLSLQPKLLAASVIMLVLIIGTGFASVQFIKLYNDKGEEWVTIHPYNEAVNQPISETSDVLDEYMTRIEEGEAIAVYNPNNKEQIVTVQVKPITYKEWQPFLTAVNHKFPLPKILNSFYYATVSHTAKNPDIERLIEESQANGDNVTYEKLELLDDIQFITIQLVKGEYNYTISMSEGQLWESVYTDKLNSANVQQIKISGIDGFLASNEDGTNVMWRSSVEMGDVFYQITTNNTSQQVSEEITALMNEILVDK